MDTIYNQMLAERGITGFRGPLALALRRALPPSGRYTAAACRPVTPPPQEPTGEPPRDATPEPEAAEPEETPAEAPESGQEDPEDAPGAAVTMLDLPPVVGAETAPMLVP